MQSGQKPPLGTRHIGLYYIIQVSSEMSVLWDSSLRVHIIAEDSMKGQVCGMCGNNNGLADDDFQVPDGSLVTSGNLLVDKWRAHSKKCHAKTDDYCLAKDQLKSAFAIEACKVLDSEPFAECRELINFNEYYEDCKQSACSCSRGGDCECLCAAIATFGRACAVAGAPVRWRTAELCPLMCEAREKHPGGKGFSDFANFR